MVTYIYLRKYGLEEEKYITFVHDQNQLLTGKNCQPFKMREFRCISRRNSKSKESLKSLYSKRCNCSRQ